MNDGNECGSNRRNGESDKEMEGEEEVKGKENRRTATCR